MTKGGLASESVGRRLEADRRTRLLTVLCLSGAVAHLVIVGVEVRLHGMTTAALTTRLALDVGLILAPLVLRWTGSLRIAALIVGSAVAGTLPAIALQSEGLSTPALIALPTVPLILAAFVGGLARCSSARRSPPGSSRSRSSGARSRSSPRTCAPIPA